MNNEKSEDSITLTRASLTLCLPQSERINASTSRTRDFPVCSPNIAEDLGDAKTGKNASRVAFIVSCLWGERDPVPASSASYFGAESVRRLVT